MNSECSICYNEPNPKFTLLCNHDFCGGCILQWYNINQNCPMCRHEINEDEIWEKYLIYKIKNHDNNKAETILKIFFKFILEDIVFLKSYLFMGKIIICNYYFRKANQFPCYSENVYMYQKWIS